MCENLRRIFRAELLKEYPDMKEKCAALMIEWVDLEYRNFREECKSSKILKSTLEIEKERIFYKGKYLSTVMKLLEYGIELKTLVELVRLDISELLTYDA